MKFSNMVAVWIAAALIGYGTGEAAKRLMTGNVIAASGDFMCTIEGDQSFMVEDIESAKRDGVTWEVTTEAMVYVYGQQYGEVCSVERAK